MLVTLARRFAVRTLDTVVARGERSSKAPARHAARTLDKLRSAAGLKTIEVRTRPPAWPTVVEDAPMWDSDRKKLDKHRRDQGIAGQGDDAAPAAAPEVPKAPEPAIKIYITRGCPYCRAALDLLRQREYPFVTVDASDDAALRSWLKLVTKRSTTPQIFIHGENIGGFDELRELDHRGELARLVQPDGSEPVASDSPPAEAAPRPSTPPVAHSKRRADGSIGLKVLRPEQSPFELSDIAPVEDGAAQPVLEGDELLAKVREVLDECRPLVQADGGDIMLLDVTTTSVNVELTGNCVGCPSAQATLRQGIERRIKAHLPQIQELRSPQLSG